MASHTEIASGLVPSQHLLVVAPPKKKGPLEGALFFAFDLCAGISRIP